MKLTYFLAVVLAIALTGCKPSLEKQIVGTWKADVAKSSLPQPDPKKTASFKMILGTASLEFKADKTCNFNFVLSIDGTWTLKNSTVSLKLTNASLASNNSDTMDFVVDADGKTMTFTSTDPKQPGTLVFVKSG